MESKIPAIDWLRGLASLAVAYYHITLCWRSGPVRASGSLGWLGVEVFFVISGFVIPYSIAITYPKYTPGSFINFLMRRIIRIELPVTLNVIMCVVLSYLSAATPGFRGTPPNITAAQFFSNVFYLVPLTGEAWLNAVYWTLAYEFVFYISVGSLFVLLFSRKWEICWYVTVLILNVAAYHAGGDGLVLLFVIGMSVCRYVIGLDRLIATVGIVGLCVFTVGFSHGLEARGLEISLSALLTAVVIGQGRNVKMNWVGQGALQWLGTLSYSLYLVHVPLGGRVFNIAARFISDSYVQQLTVSVAALAASIAFAVVFHKSIERPAMMLAKRMKVKATNVRVSGAGARDEIYALQGVRSTK